MKINNLKILEVRGDKLTNYLVVATVNVEEGVCLWKKRCTAKVCKKYGGSWFWMDTGIFTPGFIVEDLCRAYEAINGSIFKEEQEY